MRCTQVINPLLTSSSLDSPLSRSQVVLINRKWCLDTTIHTTDHVVGAFVDEYIFLVVFIPAIPYGDISGCCNLRERIFCSSRGFETGIVIFDGIQSVKLFLDGGQCRLISLVVFHINDDGLVAVDFSSSFSVAKLAGEMK